MHTIISAMTLMANGGSFFSVLYEFIISQSLLSSPTICEYMYTSSVDELMTDLLNQVHKYRPEVCILLTFTHNDDFSEKCLLYNAGDINIFFSAQVMLIERFAFNCIMDLHWNIKEFLIMGLTCLVYCCRKQNDTLVYN